MVDSAASKVRKGKEPIPVEVRKLKRKRQKYYPKDTKFIASEKRNIKGIKDLITGKAKPFKLNPTRKSGPKGRPGSQIHKATSVKRSGANYSGD